MWHHGAREFARRGWGWGPVWLQNWALPKTPPHFDWDGSQVEQGCSRETEGDRLLDWNQKLERSYQSHFAGWERVCSWGWLGSGGHARGISLWGAGWGTCVVTALRLCLKPSFELEVMRCVWRSWRHQSMNLRGCCQQSSSGFLGWEQSGL